MSISTRVKTLEASGLGRMGYVSAILERQQQRAKLDKTGCLVLVGAFLILNLVWETGDENATMILVALAFLAVLVRQS